MSVSLAIMARKDTNCNLAYLICPNDAVGEHFADSSMFWIPPLCLTEKSLHMQ